MEPKYIILHDESVFIISSKTSHNLLLHSINHKEIRSAGFFRIKKYGLVEVFGASHTLGIGNNGEEDERLIELTLQTGRFAKQG